MEDRISRLFDLIASKSFEELNDEEKNFVLKEISEAEYRLQRTVLASTAELDVEEAEPLPLILPNDKKRALGRTIPLYQAMIAAAACLAAGFFLFPHSKSSSIDFQFLENPIRISLANVPNKMEIIHDTIREQLYLNSPVKLVHDTMTIVQTVVVQNETRMLEAGNGLNPIPLDKDLLRTRTLSAKDDGSVELLPNLNDYSSMK